MSTGKALLRLWELGQTEHTRLRIAITLAVLGVLGGMIPYIATAKIVSALIRQENHSAAYFGILCLLGFIGYFLRSVLYAEALAFSHRAAFSILKTVRERLMEKLPRLPLGAVLDRSSGETKQIIVDQVESMERPLAHLLPEMTANLAGPLGIFIYLLILDWRMALLSLVSIPVGMFFMGIVMRDYGKRYEESVAVNSAMNASIVEYMGGIEVIKAFNQGENSYKKYAERIRANASYYYNWMKSCQYPFSLSRVLAPTSLITVLPVGWLLYMQGNLREDTFITVIILSLGIAGPLLAAMGFIDSLEKVGTVVGSIDKILGSEEQIHGGEEVSLQDYNIDLQKVSFAYHDEEEILHDISLHIPEHSVTALVGESGSGKTTIARLIAGYWDIRQGSIQIGGVDTGKIPLPQLYDLVAFVSQDNYLFNETVRENIRLGNPGASDAEVEKAARLSGCHDFICDLEEGYETMVGSNGGHLSGGERQRISIARAMLKDAPIVILDEATAYIDPENETILQRAISRLLVGKTVIVIAHRLSTIKDAGQIVVIKEGRVNGIGRHEELLRENAQYRTMWRAHIGAKEETL
nr:ABC transporter ATP-binding protein [Shuttleworthia satelles]